jgi:hypothetical protein
VRAFGDIQEYALTGAGEPDYAVTGRLFKVATFHQARCRFSDGFSLRRW